MKSPADYKFDAKECLFRHQDKKFRSIKFPTCTTIETPLVSKDRYNVCIDGFITLKAREACASGHLDEGKGSPVLE